MIQVTENIRIAKADERNLQLEVLRQIKTKDGMVEKWCADGFYGDLKSALLGAVRRYGLTLADEDLDIKYAIKCLIDLEQRISSKIKEIKENGI